MQTIAHHAGKPVRHTPRRTGWQLIYDLRPEFSSDRCHAFQHETGCLDAPTAMDAGSVIAVETYRYARFVRSRYVLRGDTQT